MVDVLHGALELYPRHAELLELHERHRPGGVLEQRLIHPQRDRLAGLQLTVDQVLLKDLPGQVLSHVASIPARRSQLTVVDAVRVRDDGAVGTRRRGCAHPERVRPDVEERAHRDRRDELDVQPARACIDPARKRHRLRQRRRDHSLMGVAVIGALMVLLDEAPPADDARSGLLGVEQQAEEVRPPAPEAELVVDEHYFKRKALIRTSYCWASRA
jgi:hypothetical protein